MSHRPASDDSSARSVAVTSLHRAANRQMSFCVPRRSTKIRGFGRSATFGGRTTFLGLWTRQRFLPTRDGRRKNDHSGAAGVGVPISDRPATAAPAAAVAWPDAFGSRAGGQRPRGNRHPRKLRPPLACSLQNGLPRGRSRRIFRSDRLRRGDRRRLVSGSHARLGARQRTRGRTCEPVNLYH